MRSSSEWSLRTNASQRKFIIFLQYKQADIWKRFALNPRYGYSPLARAFCLTPFQGDHHRKQRKMLNPVFSLKHMRGLIPVFYPIAYKVGCLKPFYHIRSERCARPRSYARSCQIKSVMRMERISISISGCLALLSSILAREALAIPSTPWTKRLSTHIVRP